MRFNLQANHIIKITYNNKKAGGTVLGRGGEKGEVLQAASVYNLVHCHVRHEL